MSDNYIRFDFKKIGERLKEIRGNESQADFAKKYGLLQADISRLERGDVANPSPEVLYNICINNKKPINLGWLLTGEGTKYCEERKDVMERGEATIQKDPRLSNLMEKLEHIYKEGTLKDRAEVRGIIEEVYDIIIEPGKKTIAEEGVQAAEEAPPKKKRRAVG